VGNHAYTQQDARELLDAAIRHTQAWKADGSHEELSHALGAWERLTSVVENLRAPLVEAQFAHETDNADMLAIVWAEGVGDRKHGFDPDGSPS
jgi:hypothetical protein